jgi:hypothetical protein
MITLRHVWWRSSMMFIVLLQLSKIAAAAQNSYLNGAIDSTDWQQNTV